MGIAHFDGVVLRGSFHPKMLDRLVNGTPVAMRSLRTDFWIGEFEATRRDDGNFDVVIKRWDGKWRGDKPAPNLWMTPSNSASLTVEPEFEQVKDHWRLPL